MMSFTGYINNTMIKSSIYFASHMYCQTIYGHHAWVILCIYTGPWYIQTYYNACFVSLHIHFFQEKYLRQPSIN